MDISRKDELQSRLGKLVDYFSSSHRQRQAATDENQSTHNWHDTYCGFTQMISECLAFVLNNDSDGLFLRPAHNGPPLRRAS